jgi:hypothetical protein
LADYYAELAEEMTDLRSNIRNVSEQEEALKAALAEIDEMESGTLCKRRVIPFNKV